ncbi:YncE family protein [Corticimicrobacter populi]|uniref:TieB n=1 Tax=Corticimicrobacter populi TaxID=2175229 RepID=A0A2V1K6Y7_9BURK|nr:YncE family protein [Corticimicrobacter populi]PWF24722.1 TieB [Corticimicrobacter populi]
MTTHHLSSHRLSNPLKGALTAGLACLLALSSAFGASPPVSDKDRFWMRTNYLQEPEEGVYELQFNAPTGAVFGAAIDRVRRGENRGYLYAFDGETMQIKGRYEMPYRAFSLAQDGAGKWLYVGHTQAASLRVSRVSPQDGKVAVTSERLHVEPSAPQDEHLRHMVYNDRTGELFVAYIGKVGEGESRQSVYRLLVLDGQTLQLKGEVEGAFPSVGYALTLDPVSQHLYTAGRDYINEIDPVSRQVIRHISLDQTQPRINNLVGLAVDAQGGRIFASQFIHQPDDENEGEQDGLYVFDLKTGAQTAFVPTGEGAVTLAYNRKHDEIYVSNFFGGTIGVVDGKTYQLTKRIPGHVFPNMMAQSADGDALYVGLKQGFSKQWNPEEFVEGAREQVLRISLDRDQPAAAVGH